MGDMRMASVGCASRRTRRFSARTALVAVAVSVVLLGTAVHALGRVDPPGIVAREAVRGSSLQVAMAPQTRVFMVGDSVLAGVEAYGYDSWLGRAEWHLRLAPCRRLVATSCALSGRRRPPTALQEIAAFGVGSWQIGPRDVLVIAVGYNDNPARFRTDFRTIVAQARSVGFRTIVWMNYASGSPRWLPEHGTSSRFAPLNAALLAELATGSYPDVYWWNFAGFIASQPGGLARDGIHLSAAGAAATSTWLTGKLRHEAPGWMT